MINQASKLAESQEGVYRLRLAVWINWHWGVYCGQALILKGDSAIAIAACKMEICTKNALPCLMITYFPREKEMNQSLVA